MNPVTGPFSKVEDSHWPGWYGNPIRRHLERSWYRQKKPYDQPLPFTFRYANVDSVVDSGNPRSYTVAPSFNTQAESRAYNKAYAKFVGLISDPSQWAVNLLECNKSLEMIAKRAWQIKEFARKLHRFDIHGATQELYLGRKSPRRTPVRKNGKSFGDTFLEYRFGWEPLVKDIGNAVETLQGPFPSKWVKAGAVSNLEGYFRNDSGSFHNSDQYTGRLFVTLRGQVEVINPNLYLANQLGFVNPLSVAWELVPYSFVVDWFSNVGQVLSAMTDFCGLSVKNASRTTYSFSHRSEKWWTDANGVYAGSESTAVYTFRQTGLGSGPTLELKPFKGFSPVRGATAISLLLQQLGRR
jgi:hypothetical protein